MISIAGSEIASDSIASQYKTSSIQRKSFDKLSSSSEIYKYASLSQLKFELDMRAGIVNAAIELSKNKMVFRTFRKSICNIDYWERSNEGGFLLKDGIKPSDAIKDIFTNSHMYGTECATAIVIIYYKALVDLYAEEQFNDIFQGIYLMNWENVDSDLGISYYRSVSDVLPGDCQYFKNPDVNPLTPEWQGENVIDIGNGTYYGHGIGIRNAEGVIEVLNKKRKSGATQSAYLLDSASRPAFKLLAVIET